MFSMAQMYISCFKVNHDIIETDVTGKIVQYV